LRKLVEGSLRRQRAFQEDDLEAATASDDMEFEDYLLAPRIPVDNDPLEW